MIVFSGRKVNYQIIVSHKFIVKFLLRNSVTKYLSLPDMPKPRKIITLQSLRQWMSVSGPVTYSTKDSYGKENTHRR